MAKHNDFRFQPFPRLKATPDVHQQDFEKDRHRARSRCDSVFRHESGRLIFWKPHLLRRIDAVIKIAHTGVVIAVRLLARILVQEVFSAMERLQII